MNNFPRFIFVGGAGRSGTTLVQKLLLSHPQVDGGAEFFFTKDILQLHKNMYESSVRANMSQYYTEEQLKNRIIEFYQSFFQNFSNPSIKFISEKTPSNIEVADLLLDLFEDAIFINVYRDGRAVVNSHLQVKQRGKTQGKNLTEIGSKRTSRYWSNCIQLAGKTRNNHPQRFFDLKYEDLLDDPMSSFKEIFDYLGLEGHDVLKDPEKMAQDKADNKVHINEIWYTKEMYEKGIDKSRLELWKKEMSSWSILISNSVMYKELRSLGYPISSLYSPFYTLFDFLSNWKERVKDWWLIKPFVLLKRKLI